MLELDSFDNDKGAQEIVLSDLDETIRDMFARVCMGKCGIALLRFLDANASSLHTAHDIAFHMRAPDAEVECELAALVELGLARVQTAAGLAFFGATTDPARRRLMRDLCLWQNRWQGRIARIEQLVFGGFRADGAMGTDD